MSTFTLRTTYSPSDIQGIFFDSLDNLSAQKGSMYGATVIARLHESVDYNHFGQKAIKYLLRNIRRYEDGYYYFLERDEKLVNKHDQFITLLSGIYALYTNEDFKRYTEKLLKSMLQISKTLEDDLQKTIGAEFLIPYYVKELEKAGIFSPDTRMRDLLKRFTVVYEEKIASKSRTLFYSLEALEKLANSDTITSIFPLMNNSEILVPLANRRISGAYVLLSSYLKGKSDYRIKVFETGEVFDIAWQFHIICESGIIGGNTLNTLAHQLKKYILSAGFGVSEGVSISQKFLLKDADTTALAAILMRYTGMHVPCSIFSTYKEKRGKKYFFCSYPREIRISYGTMGHILNALSYMEIEGKDFFEYLDIIHTNIQSVLKNQNEDIDKWHSSKCYFYANILIAYVNMTKKLASEYPKSSLYSTFTKTRDIIAKRVIVMIREEGLYIEEIAWLILGLVKYYNSSPNKENMEYIIQMIAIMSKQVKEDFISMYDNDIKNLENLWIVKAAYSPLNIIKMLLVVVFIISDTYAAEEV